MAALREKGSNSPNSPSFEKSPTARYEDREALSDTFKEETLHRGLKARQISMIAVCEFRTCAEVYRS